MRLLLYPLNIQKSPTMVPHFTRLFDDGRDFLERNPQPFPVSSMFSTAANLYNGMIAPVVPFAIRGAIWYQGEANIGRAHQYRTLFPLMIRDWRAAWSERDFPFDFVLRSSTPPWRTARMKNLDGRDPFPPDPNVSPSRRERAG